LENRHDVQETGRWFLNRKREWTKRECPERQKRPTAISLRHTFGPMYAEKDRVNALDYSNKSSGCQTSIERYRVESSAADSRTLN
jgi:hypothetical protein